MDNDFTIEKIQNLIDNHNWVLAKQGNIYFLHQKDKEYMKTNWFTLSSDEVSKLKTSPDLGEGE